MGSHNISCTSCCCHYPSSATMIQLSMNTIHTHTHPHTLVPLSYIYFHNELLLLILIVNAHLALFSFKKWNWKFLIPKWSYLSTLAFFTLHVTISPNVLGGSYILVRTANFEFFLERERESCKNQLGSFQKHHWIYSTQANEACNVHFSRYSSI
jgi:hypothetical protein